ncbi:hypothetical protein BDV38DRAFT_241061 [Aspergillus pseudotamarii]|uniref:Uncharacterized protein n=1 Tax=Aspergillus pseudotamarii TaxID=132259 RepID=A0A5N6SZM0_ASPPS|nr:uncharacterized protein BDV38DRAFT_241061 [Aspergillus pseudotamarii]KAE8140138.1 hypothetical protein BDV38DRAFT_241061 [Aspergillus pseudotamarii]
MLRWLTDSYNSTISPSSRASYKVKGGSIVKQTRTSPRSMSPWAIIEVNCDLHFLGYDWILEWSQRNETDDDVVKESNVPIGVMTENRIEQKDALLASLDLKDLRLGIGGEEKYFSEEEIGDITTERRWVTVKAHSNIFYYQKRYNFLSQLWPFVYAENKLWVAALPGSTKPSTIDTPFSVMADEFLAVPDKLEGEGKVTTVEAAKLFRMGDYPLRPGSPNLENKRIVSEVSQLRARGCSVCTS